MTNVKCHYTDHHHRWFVQYNNTLNRQQFQCEWCEALVDIGSDEIAFEGKAVQDMLYEASLYAHVQFYWENLKELKRERARLDGGVSTPPTHMTQFGSITECLPQQLQSRWHECPEGTQISESCECPDCSKNREQKPIGLQSGAALALEQGDVREAARWHWTKPSQPAIVSIGYQILSEGIQNCSEALARSLESFPTQPSASQPDQNTPEAYSPRSSSLY